MFMLRTHLRNNMTIGRLFTTQANSIKNITGPQLQEWLNKPEITVKSTAKVPNLIIVDVRERSEVETHGKIKGALNVPLKVAPSLFSAALSDLDKHAKIVFQCMSGRRSNEAAKIAVRLGFQDVYNLEGGLTAWTGPTQPFMNNHSPWVHTLFEAETETAQYVITDLETREAYIVDPVLDYDPFASTVRPTMANSLLRFIEQHELNVTKIIDTHVHADHLTASFYLKSKLPNNPETWIGSRVKEVQQVFGFKYNLGTDELSHEGNQFDKLVSKDNKWLLGKNIQCSVISTPGHTPACMAYKIGDTAFVGDTLFMPDIGTARCDFPGGSAEQMFNSVHEMYNQWPEDTRIYVGHDYPPPGTDRPYQVMTTLEVHKKMNKMINENVSLEEYVKMRKERDAKLKAPRFIHPSIQTNLRGGILPNPEVSVHDKKTEQQFFKIPIKWSS